MLWKLAGAKSQEFFEANSAGVLSEFNKCEVDGKPVLLCRRMVSVYATQEKKHRQTLSDHFKSGQRVSVQNRPTKMAVKDLVVLAYAPSTVGPRHYLAGGFGGSGTALCRAANHHLPFRLM
jgi:hypothetical protein